MADTVSPTGRFAPLDHALGRRINVRGGGGKTTLARALARKHSLPFIELDAINWLPGWREREGDDFRDKTQEAIDAAMDGPDNGWIVDGNYTGNLGDLVLRQADTVVWLDLPWRVMFWRVLRRSVMRAIDGEMVCGENRESWRNMLSRHSLWWYYVTHRQRIITRGYRLMPMVPDHVPIIRIASARQLDEFYRLHGLSRSGTS